MKPDLTLLQPLGPDELLHQILYETIGSYINSTPDVSLHPHLPSSQSLNSRFLD